MVFRETRVNGIRVFPAKGVQYTLVIQEHNENLRRPGRSRDASVVRISYPRNTRIAEPVIVAVSDASKDRGWSIEDFGHVEREVLDPCPTLSSHSVDELIGYENVERLAVVRIHRRQALIAAARLLGVLGYHGQRSYTNCSILASGQPAAEHLARCASTQALTIFSRPLVTFRVALRESMTSGQCSTIFA